MTLRVQNNIAAMNAHKNLQTADAAMAKSLERLSSGYRINRAADDAAGLSISAGFRADIASFKVASRNTTEANAMLQVAEGGMEQIENMLTRLKELATQAASANVGSTERTKINAEGNALISEIDRIANSTKYGSTNLLNGTFGATKASAMGAGAADGMIGSTYNTYTNDLAGIAPTVAAIGSGITEGQWYVVTNSAGVTGNAMYLMNASQYSAATITEKVELGSGTFTSATSITFANIGFTLTLTGAGVSTATFGYYAASGATIAADNATTGASTSSITIAKTGLTSLSVENAIATGTYTFSAPTTASIMLDNGTNSQTVTNTGPGQYAFSNLGITFNLGDDYADEELSGMTITVSASNATGNTFQIGAKNDSDNRISLSIGNVLGTSQNGLNLSVDQLTTASNAQAFLDTIDNAVSTLAGARGDIGASMNRLSYAAANLLTTIENTQAAESVIRDVDMADEMTSFTKNQILVQAGTAMLSQANQSPQLLLSLIGG